MPLKCVCVAFVAIFVLAASRSAQAQMTLDVTKVNCDQFVHHKISEPRLIAGKRCGPPYLGLSKNQRLTELCRKIDAGGGGGRSPEHLAH